MGGARNVTASGEHTEPKVDADGIYRQIGLYVVVFQSLHDLLLQICWLLAEPAYDPQDRRKLSKLTFHPLVSETGHRVYAFLISGGRETSEFTRRFHVLLSKCRAIGLERNRVVHSGFVHLESFDQLHGIVMSDLQPGSDEPVAIENEYLTPLSFDRRLKEIADTYMRLSMARTQLIRWRP